METYGSDFAQKSEYTVYSRSPNSTTWVKHVSTGTTSDQFVLYLRLDKQGTAELSRYIGLVECKICFGYPNKNFLRFENEIAGMQQGNLLAIPAKNT